MLFKEPDRAFLDAVFQPGLFELRRAMPILREENQPTGVLVGWLKDRMRQTNAATVSPGDSMAVSKNLFDTNRASFAIVPPDSAQQRYLATLEREVNDLRSRGVEVIFIEVPISPELTSSPLAERSREVIMERFPEHRFLRTEPGIQWRTADGLHLQPSNAQRYSGWLAAQLRTP
jgi:hypothetical protein